MVLFFAHQNHQMLLARGSGYRSWEYEKADLLLPRMRLMAMKSMKGTWLGMAMGPRSSKDLKICFQLFSCFFKGNEKLYERIQEETGMSKLKIFNLSRIGFNTGKCSLGRPTAGARELRQNWAGSNGKKSANLSQSWKLTQDTQRKIYPGLTRLKFLPLDVLGSEVPIQYHPRLSGLWFQPPENHYIFIQWSISSEMEIQIPKAIPKKLPPGKLT